MLNFKIERKAYLAMKEQLLAEHEGEWAAFYEGLLVAVSPDETRLIKRVRKERGNIPAFIQKIEKHESQIRVRHSRRLGASEKTKGGG